MRDDLAKIFRRDALGRYWLTAEEVAQMFNVSVRTVDERWRRELDREAVAPPWREYRYVYDFELEDDLDNYVAPRGTSSVDPLGRGGDWYETATGNAPVDDEDDAACVYGSYPESHLEGGYDYGLEPVSRRMVVLDPRLYRLDAVIELAERKALARRKKGDLKRGSNGRFTA